MDELRRDALAIRDAALRAVEPAALVRRHLDPRGDSAVWVYGAGKAARAMASAVEQVLGERVQGGLVAVPEGPGPALERVSVVVGSHPVPDARSVAAGRRMLAEVAARAPDDALIGLWSGGASALLEVPAPGVPLEAIVEGTRRALAEGLDIRALNSLRRTWSAIKGGKLAQAGPARWRNLVLSDVAGDDPALVGSGPAVREGDGAVVIGSNALGLEAARAEAFALRYAALVLDDDLAGEARAAGEALARAIRALPPGHPPMALLLGGEPVVSGIGPGVEGGRMQELALAAALGIEGVRAVVLATSSDGRDGPTDAAGALVDGTTVGRARALGLDPEGALARHDSGPVLAAVEDRLVTGPSGTNVRDWVVGLVAAG